ncbi:MAG: AAA family ATPase, partial [Chlorobi bacterium]|nr:AAA family ATPase [Chlorobiota bacterium]
MSYKPLQMFALAYRDPGSIALIKAKAEKQFNILKGLVPDFPNDLLSVEPSFVSADYGLQGRLDLMTESATDKGRKNIIELKSGKAPSRDMYFKSADGKTVSIGLWSNHLAQTTGYNLLVDSTFDRRSGYSQILYSSDDTNPLRNAPNIQGKKQELMIHRNHIIAGERRLAEGDSSLLSNLGPEEFGIRPPYTEKDLEFFSDKMNALDEIETAYFSEYLSFLQREIFTAKIGNGRNGFGYSALWNDSLTEKIKAYRVISDLTLNQEESDFKKYHLVFNRPESGENVSVFRKGDIVLLYPLNDDGSADPLSRQLLKGFIKEISPERIKVSLRNKLFNDTFFDSDNTWALEPDYIESSSKSLVRSLFDFVKSDKSKKDIILGRELPKSIKVEPKYSDGLNDSQKIILTKALSAQDYFLLQGPPGTGKTSYMLRYIVRNIFETSEENILILAYTNRAVDEICSSLKKISTDFPFLRTGSKDSSVHSENLISQLSDDGTLRELYIRFRSTRVFVSTVSSVLSNPEILEMISFDTAIIDEASQILEPQIAGILASVGRFIMIGDEKQLPAITTNQKNTENFDHEELNKIGLTNLSDSLFERLLRINIAAENYEAFDMLTQQARMHEDIQNFPNKFFYEGKLQTFPKFDWQRSAEQVFSAKSDDPVERTVAESRMIFIESKFEKNSKVNFEEARICSLLTRMIKRVYGDEFDENTVGIISPFRAQCAEIYNQTDDDIRDLLSVDTVERFQGSEREIIIISFAANYRSQIQSIQSLTFIKDKLIDRKLNVALTRARRHVIILGNPEILETSPIFVDLIAYIKAGGHYIGGELSESLI